MRFLSIIEPWETLIKEEKKSLKQEVGRHPIEVNFTFMQVTKRLKGMIHTQVNYLN